MRRELARLEHGRRQVPHLKFIYDTLYLPIASRILPRVGPYQIPDVEILRQPLQNDRALAATQLRIVLEMLAHIESVLQAV